MFLWTLMKFWNIWEMKIESLKTIYRQCWIDSDCERKSWNCPTAQKMKFSIKDFIIKCDQIRNGDWPTPLSPYPHPVPPPLPPPSFGLFVRTFDWVIQFRRNLLIFREIYMEWIFRKKTFWFCNDLLYWDQFFNRW